MSSFHFAAISSRTLLTLPFRRPASLLLASSVEKTGSQKIHGSQFDGLGCRKSRSMETWPISEERLQHSVVVAVALVGFRDVASWRQDSTGAVEGKIISNQLVYVRQYRCTR
ncbi:hypothetical protein CISG_07637 [Coccidioides immitis RMSCC 3703]|uniref:Uncharacterized protein n=2 Tax=Coccidioides immitis TaxID=5501 RepID=A0A0J8R3A1_COCIT|nr:hypothetical protein CIRG_02822 [Coccidioides immitis RMSCC 2394]KMU79206.1 hypothetical protein CISG_07637 [Coccidioides immitis RMSCC 3703]